MQKKPSALALASAFAAIYVIWGSTYLAIFYALETLPPLVMAGIRHLVAGVILYGWTRMRGASRPSGRHWRSSALIGGLLLLGGNGGVCWAEQYVPSGVAALLITTVPVWMVLLNWLRPGGIRPTLFEVIGLVLGLGGVAVLVGKGDLAGASRVDPIGAMVLVGASLSWAFGSIYSRYVTLPDSPFLATAMQMLSGGALLLIVGLAFGEGSRIAWDQISWRSIAALGYLVFLGSLVAFTAYVWLLRVSTPARVSTYAFVNPAVAVLLGCLVAHEVLTGRMIVASIITITGVALITLSKGKRRQPEPGGTRIERTLSENGVPHSGQRAVAGESPCSE